MPMTHLLYRRARAIALMAAALVSASCSAAATDMSQPPVQGRLGSEPGRPGEFVLIVASSDLAVGANQRFAVAILGPDNRPITDASVELDLYKVTGANQAQLRSRSDTIYREWPSAPDRGLYVARTDLDEPGDWGAAVIVKRPGQEPAEARAAFKVKTRSATPSVGEPVPLSNTPTGGTADAIRKFSSASDPDPSLYRVTIADALKQGKPLAVLFASPAFCTSRTCGPSLEVLEALHAQFGDSASFIHVELYQDARPPQLAPSVKDWKLPSDPWLFIVGRDGRLIDKFESMITVDETAPVLSMAING